MLIPRRGSYTDITANTISGTRRPETLPTEFHDGDRPSGGQTGAHENRREHGAAKLKARCWCQRKIVKVPTDVIRRAETLSCGQDECRKGIH